MSDLPVTRLPDFIVRQIATNGRCYSHEGRSLAAEVLAHREAAAKNAAAGAAQHYNPYGGIPYPGAPTPPTP